MKNWFKWAIGAAVFVVVAVLFAWVEHRVNTTTAATLFTAIALVFSVVSLTYQVLHASLVQSADLLMRFEQNFFGCEYIKQRSLAARNYIQDSTNFKEMEDILDFFETVAMFTRKKALDLSMVWHTFDYWMERYYAVALPHILARQKQEPGVWEDFAWLMPKIKKLQVKKGGSNLNDAELNRFLLEESLEN